MGQYAFYTESMNNKLLIPQSKNTVEDSWDSDSSHVAANNNIYMVYEPLTFPSVALDNNNLRYPVASNLLPRLAENWNDMDNGKRWHVKLRKNIKNYYGNELTADDVYWSWLRAFELKRVGRWRTRRVGGVYLPEDVVVLDDHTLEFNLNRPNEAFPQYLSFSTTVIVDSTEAKKHITDNDPWATEWLSKNPAGWGAFQLDKQEHNQIRLIPNTSYWAGKPAIDEIVQFGVGDRETGLRALEQGDANCLLHLYPEEFQRFAGNDNFTTGLVRSNHAKLEFDYTSEPFDDKNVRQAVCYVLPYNEIIDKAYLGHATRSYSPILSVSQGYSKKHNLYDTDVSRAQELMQQSKYPQGFTTILQIDPTNESVRFAEIAQNALSQIGIQLEIKQLQWPDPLKDGRPSMWYHSDCGHALTEPVYDLCHDFDPPIGILGGLFIRNEEFVEKINAVKNASIDEKMNMYTDIQQEITDFAPCAFIAENQTGWVIHKLVDPWVFSEDNLGLNATVWSTHRNQMNT